MISREHVRRTFDHTSMFQSAAFSPKRSYSEPEIRSILRRMTGTECGNVLRAKGTLAADRGLWRVDLTPGCEAFAFEEGSAPPMLNVIGRNLNRKHIRSILEDLS